MPNPGVAKRRNNLLLVPRRRNLASPPLSPPTFSDPFPARVLPMRCPDSKRVGKGALVVPLPG